MLHSPAFTNNQNLVLPETTPHSYSNKAVILSQRMESTYISAKHPSALACKVIISLIKGRDSILASGAPHSYCF